MSLFKAREYWSCQVGSGEQFDYGCLKIGSFNDDSNSNFRKKYMIYFWNFQLKFR